MQLLLDNMRKLNIADSIKSWQEKLKANAFYYLRKDEIINMLDPCVILGNMNKTINNMKSTHPSINSFIHLFY